MTTRRNVLPTFAWLFLCSFTPPLLLSQGIATYDVIFAER